MEPVITVVLCHPMSIGAAAQKSMPNTVATTPRAASTTVNRIHDVERTVGSS